jgi:hypothetical protein
MKKRMEKNPNDTEDLGLSRSERRALDVAEGIRRDLDRVQREIDIVQDAQRSVGFDAAQVDTAVRAQADGASPGLDEVRVSLNDMRVNLADFSPALGSNAIPSASEMLTRQAESVRASLHLPPSLLRENVVKGLAKPPIPPSNISQILDTRSRMQGMLSALPDKAQSPYPGPPPISAITKSLRASTGFSTRETPQLISNLAGIERSWSGMGLFSINDLGKTGFGHIHKDLQWPSLLKNYQSSASIAKDLQAFSALDFRKGFSQKKLAQIFGGFNTIAVGGAAGYAPYLRAFDSISRIAGTMGGFGSILRQGRTSHDTLARHWDGIRKILDNAGRIDWETLQEAARRAERIREARQPRTRIGFAALKAYDALYMNHPWVADEFLAKVLGIELPTDLQAAADFQVAADLRQALWIVLRQAFERNSIYPARWIVLDDERAAAYLRTAVYRQARRVRRDREKADRIWATGRDPQTKQRIEVCPQVLDPQYALQFVARSSETPEHIVIGTPDVRVQTLKLLYSDGSPQDKRIVEMLEDGYDLPAVAEVVGWPEVQRFQRKARRWIARNF